MWSSKLLVGRSILLVSDSLFTVWAIGWRLATGTWSKTKEKRTRFLVLGQENQTIDFGRQHHSVHKTSEFVFLTKSKQSSSLSRGFYSSQKFSATQPIIQNNTCLLIDSINDFVSLSRQSWTGVLIDTTQPKLSAEISQELINMQRRGIFIYSLADFCEQFWQKIPPSYIHDDWFTSASGFSILHNQINVKLKQAVDSLAAAVLLIVTLPLTLLTAIAIKLDSPGSIFYSQIRTGLNGKKFTIYKFRSMCQNAEQMGVQWTAEKDPRITRIGLWLRKTRIDELPQLWNILKGEMSLIGPRPERPEFDVQLRQAIPYYDVRYLVKPGITGWAQVRYPYGASVEDAYQKVAYDLYYIKNYSLWLDVAIALKTVRVVLLGKGR